MLCSMNHAVACVTSRSRYSFMLENYFRLVRQRWMAMAHLRRGILELVSQVPVLMLK